VPTSYVREELACRRPYGRARFSRQLILAFSPTLRRISVNVGLTRCVGRVKARIGSIVSDPIHIIP